MAQAITQQYLVDRFGRHVDYVRISVTDRCDFRCVYCMSEQMEFLPRQQLLTLEELGTVARAFTELGVVKLRITGGEPLVRHNIVALLEQLGQLPGLRELVLTTNGSQLPRYAVQLRKAGVRRINISLDSLQAERFHRMSRRGQLHKVLEGIAAARAVGFERIKLNAVILNGHNQDEVCALANFAGEHGLDISYIEEMPLGSVDGHNRADAYYSSDRILADLRQQFTLEESDYATGGPARYYRNVQTGTYIGLISPHSHNFCDSCNRVRLTCEGRLLLCLGQEHSRDLRPVIRTRPFSMAALKQTIREAMHIKPRGHEFQLQGEPVIMRHMNLTGG